MQTDTRNTKNDQLRYDWSIAEVEKLFNQPFNDLMYQAQQEHRHNFDPNKVQISTLLSIKTGGCPEDCGYCPQSVHHDVDVDVHALMEIEQILSAAETAKTNGASRFCMGAAWRYPKPRDFAKVVEIVKQVKAIGMDTCMTLGMLNAEQTQELKAAGLDYYNHNLDTSREFYGEIITTRTYQDRLDTLAHVRDAGMNVCCGGIVGMGESRTDRAAMLVELSNLPKHPESVPINLLVKVEGTPLSDVEALDPLEFVRTIAVARILMPKSWVRLSAGRESMSDEMQAMCFLAGANSIFYGDQLLTTPNPEKDKDKALFERLGIEPFKVEKSTHSCKSKQKPEVALTE
ncbi:MAG: biotin synthase BioB [Gammaproteobacteria bacterium]|nr:biotin synthase BioB [Gammaproteobacteria bacterium]